MPVIVALGDSNTWGYNPATQTRFARDVRWTGVMQRELGPEHLVIEEGLNGRTTIYEDPEASHRRGDEYLPPCLRSHAPLDLVILALGCNDVKERFRASPEDIAAGMETLIDIAVEEGAANILVVAPPPLARLTGFAEMFVGGAKKSRALPALYRKLAERRGVGFVDAGQFIACSELDGIHYEPHDHETLGKVLAEAVRMMLA